MFWKKPLRRIVVGASRKLAIRSNVSVGPNFHAGLGSILWAPQRLTVGRDVYVGKNVTIQVDGVIGDGVLIANAVGVVGKSDHDIRTVGVPVRHAPWVGDAPSRLSHPTRIGSDVWIGYGAIVLSGVTIGDSAIVAAGSLVTSDVPPNSIVAGSPATVRRSRFSDSEFLDHWAKLSELGLTRLSDRSIS